jgi:hypothetical protein
VDFQTKVRRNGEDAKSDVLTVGDAVSARYREQDVKSVAIAVMARSIRAGGQ